VLTELLLMRNLFIKAVGIEYEEFVETNILPAIGMNSSGFNYTQDVVDRRAIGVIPLPHGQRVEGEQTCLVTY